MFFFWVIPVYTVFPCRHLSSLRLFPQVDSFWDWREILVNTIFLVWFWHWFECHLSLIELCLTWAEFRKKYDFTLRALYHGLGCRSRVLGNMCNTISWQFRLHPQPAPHAKFLVLPTGILLSSRSSVIVHSTAVKKVPYLNVVIYVGCNIFSHPWV